MYVPFSNRCSLNHLPTVTFLCFLFLTLFSFKAEAAFLSVRPDSGAYKVGDMVNVTLEIDPEGEAISGVSASLKFDPAVFYAVGLDSKTSVIDDWESAPDFSNDDGTVTLSGTSTKSVMVNSTILSIDFRVVGRGDSALSFTDAKATTADGGEVVTQMNSPAAIYKVVPNKTYTYATVTTVQSDGWRHGIFSEAVMLNLGLLIVLLVFLGHLAYVHRQFKLRELRLKHETAEIHEQLTKIFSALRDEIYDQIRSITKRSKLSKKEAEAVAGLNQALEVSETLIDKEINDVKNLLN